MAVGVGPALTYSSAPGRWALAITVLGSGIAALDATVVNIALPVIGICPEPAGRFMSRQRLACLSTPCDDLAMEWS